MPDNPPTEHPNWGKIRPFIPLILGFLAVTFIGLPRLFRNPPGGKTRRPALKTGSPEFGGDRPGPEPALPEPSATLVSPEGDLFISDHHRILRLPTWGKTPLPFAGTGEPGHSGDGGPALKARLYDPIGLALGPRGSLYFAGAGNQRIRKVDRRGIITPLAGTGEPGFSGDGGPATAAMLHDPLDVAVDPNFNLYIADRGNRRIRKVTPQGIISTFAGGGTAPGDGGPARRGRLDDPVGVALDRAGNLFIADRGAHRVRKVDPQGIITTVAGTGEAGYSGDGGPALRAKISGPHDVAADSRGNLYIAGTGGHRVRKIDRRGVITTVAGTGRPGFSGDGGPATAARLYNPEDVSVDRNGDLYIADTGNHRIRRVDTRGFIRTVAGD